MRPGQSCPGVEFRRSGTKHLKLASFNEAGAIMPRSGRRAPDRVHHAPARFNEAGAIMPRSGHETLRERQVHMRGFNEAGAIMPRSGSAPATIPLCLPVLLQ